MIFEASSQDQRIDNIIIKFIKSGADEGESEIDSLLEI